MRQASADRSQTAAACGPPDPPSRSIMTDEPPTRRTTTRQPTTARSRPRQPQPAMSRAASWTAPAEPPGDARALVRARRAADARRHRRDRAAPSWCARRERRSAAGSARHRRTPRSSPAVLASAAPSSLSTRPARSTRPAPANPRTPTNTPITQPVTIDESSAIIDVATNAGPAVVRSSPRGVEPRVRQQPLPPQARASARGHLQLRRLDPHQPPRRRQRRHVDRRA